MYGGRAWYVLNVVQCGSKFIPIYMIYTPLGGSDCGCEVLSEAEVNAVKQWTRDALYLVNAAGALVLVP